MTSSRDSWTVTTHDWARDVDRDHLRRVRAQADVELPGGLQHLVLEVLAYAADEAEHRGRVGQVSVQRHSDGSVAVSDDGRGTDTRRDDHGQVVRKPVMATQDVRFTGDMEPVLLADGHPRRGMSSVSALCLWLRHTNHRTEGSWTQNYAHGIPEQDLMELPPSAQTGTTVHFLLDPDLESDARLDPRVLAASPWLEVTLVS
ncbi:ATP-binding protein [Ornithinimicrobium faecis]|uniref:ATP-binding protein n=1 Tax=Ornithinimicrobium faecis TaxID=2934158 RepID=UPI0021190718|nr:ATP-binding protein [Ornithinimicrobium sp. HY1745]